MSNQSISSPPDLGYIPPGPNSRGDFSFQIWREIYRAVAFHEMNAMKTGETIDVEIEVRERRPASGKTRLIVRTKMVCEPGKPAQVQGLFANMR